MRIGGTLLRLYAYLFHFALSSFLLGIAILAAEGNQALQIRVLPFSREDMISRVTMLSLAGFISLFLALKRIFEFVFPIWALVVVALLIKGYVFSSYQFAGPRGLAWALCFVLAAAVAFWGALLVLTPQRGRRY